MKANTEVARIAAMPTGEPIFGIRLECGGLVAKLTNYGATLQELWVPDAQGHASDVILGFSHIDGLLRDDAYHGATVGRVAGRIGEASFEVDGRRYKLPANDGKHCLHGGGRGLSHRLWQVCCGENGDSVFARFNYTSPDGDAGFPGNLEVTATYTLSRDRALKIAYEATTDQATPVNLTNHAYFNLRGSGDILDHVLRVWADHFLELDEERIPTGRFIKVAQTPLDFRLGKSIGQDMQRLVGAPKGYDHFFVRSFGGDLSQPLARVEEPISGRCLELYTSAPGVQIYTGNFLGRGQPGKDGLVYQQYQGFCLETQGYPDAVNHPHFPSVIVRPGQVWRVDTSFVFSTSAAGGRAKV